MAPAPPCVSTPAASFHVHRAAMQGGSDDYSVEDIMFFWGLQQRGRNAIPSPSFMARIPTPGSNFEEGEEPEFPKGSCLSSPVVQFYRWGNGDQKNDESSLGSRRSLCRFSRTKSGGAFDWRDLNHHPKSGKVRFGIVSLQFQRCSLFVSWWESLIQDHGAELGGERTQTHSYLSLGGILLM